MPTHIADLELSAPLPALHLPAGTTGALVLARSHGRPVGLVRIAARGSVTPAQIAEALARQRIRARPAGPPLPVAAPASIVVCTHERPDDLSRCLESLAPLAADGHEVIVVDNAPRGERTRQLVARYPFRYLCEPRKGQNHARNRGLRAASHPIVAYTDDDAVADRRWIDALVAPFASPRVACTTGLVLPSELETAAQEQFETYSAFRRIFERRVYQAPHTPPSTAGLAGVGANMAFRREFLLRIGGFDPRLGGIDTDTFARVLDSGMQIVYTPAALVWHRHRRTEEELHRCIFGYGVGVFGFLTKRLLEHGDLGALLTAARWLVGPFVKAAGRRLRGQGQSGPPVALLLAEARGAFLGPIRFWKEHVKYRSQERMRM